MIEQINNKTIDLYKQEKICMTKSIDFIEIVSVSKPKGKQRTHSLIQTEITLLN
jgi:hypothetical protein